MGVFMRRFVSFSTCAVVFLLWVIYTSGISYGVSGSAGVPTAVYTRDANTSKLGPGFDENAGEIFSGLKGINNIYAYNGSSLGHMGLSVVGNSSCLPGSTTHLAVPPSTGVLFDNLAVGKIVCLKSLTGASITSGTLSVSAW